MIIFADKQTIKQTDTNSKTEAHSNPLWIVGERANNGITHRIIQLLHTLRPTPLLVYKYPSSTVQ